jgi:hypothetical protein
MSWLPTIGRCIVTNGKKKVSSATTISVPTIQRSEFRISTAFGKVFLWLFVRNDYDRIVPP